MRNTWDFWLLLAAVIAWAMFKGWGVWQREQERKAELAEDLAMFQAEEAERRAVARQDSPDSAEQKDRHDPDSQDPSPREDLLDPGISANQVAPGTPNPPTDV